MPWWIWVTMCNSTYYQVLSHFFFLYLRLDKLSDEEQYLIKVRCKEDGSTEYGSFEEVADFHTKQFKQEDFERPFVDPFSQDKSIYSCEKRSLRIFPGNEKESYCDQASYAMGYKLKDKVIILLEVCYNAIDKRTDFMHYQQVPKTNSVSEMYNPVNASEGNQSSLPVAEYLEVNMYVNS